ncbi:MAG: hypothetical protein A2504_07600 [Bdellovibrionales bacterium RIFOXYD12_FULL_39_22]|nr:MAG: hypothetical protein A2385_10925 [Bdellovibrionales bacterium RIFOXYB1_FULL_39_21]OFZ41304.1 MAG: hypothetical protein A2485_00760 [Bdellovibrionales bacterium RIFOXYC12_FULL_39_17]OFZ45046.1 MAG: hypothetical protein A2404_11220 [Bdellovibrionales bacterium RIFOXYC1_FULL_39_130]OFZ74430.1 MAG: hypothetical protein A2560_11255 [Bdellovibrionales bacterium RIFOXYD1_FULL_39_84]OFZ92442.1 MAG: hypothetical protein A2504_07600 [Bdellovibrionales bacterium RIFOXYD12_FULL_39_22]HLE12498.1 ch
MLKKILNLANDFFGRFLPQMSTGVLAMLLILASCTDEEEAFRVKPKVNKSEAAKLVISGDELYYDYGRVSINYPAVRVITLKNDGDYVAKIISDKQSESFMFVGGVWPGHVEGMGSCTKEILPDSECTIVLMFLPTEMKKYQENLQFEYYSGFTNEKVTMKISGEGVGTPFVYFDTMFDYYMGDVYYNDNVLTGRTRTVNVKIKYAGDPFKQASGLGPFDLPSYLRFPNKTTDDNGPFSGDSAAECGTVLGRVSATEFRDSCEFAIEFAPDALGSYEHLFTLEYNNQSSMEQSKKRFYGRASNKKIGATLRLEAVGGQTNFASYLSQTYPLIYPETSSQPILFRLDRIDGNQDATDLTMLSLTSGAFSFAGGSFPGTGGDCSSPMVGNSCLLALIFNPAEAIKYNDRVVIKYKDGLNAPFKQTEAVSIEGSGGLPPVLAFDNGDSWDFGEISLNDSANRSFNLNLTNPETAVPYNFADALVTLSAGTAAGFTLNNGCSAHTFNYDHRVCSINVGFSPRRVLPDGPHIGIDDRYSVLRIDYNSNTASLAKELYAVGSRRARLVFQVANGFGVDGNGLVIINTAPYNPQRRIRLTAYYGLEEASFTSTFIDNNFGLFVYGGSDALADSFPGERLAADGSVIVSTSNPPCPSGTLSYSNVNCDILFNFAPTEYGLQNASYRIAYASSGSPSNIQTSSYVMSGRGVDPALLTEKSLGFLFTQAQTTVGSVAYGYFRIGNSGDPDSVAGNGNFMRASNIARVLNQSAGSAFTSVTSGSCGTLTPVCGSYIDAGVNCYLCVRFAPTSAGVFSGSLAISYRDGTRTDGTIPNVVNMSTFSFSAQAVAYVPPLVANMVVSVSSVDFGDLAIGQSATNTSIVFENRGTAAVSAMSINDNLLPAGVEYVSGCASSTLAAGASCTITLSFSPTYPGNFSGSLPVSYNSGSAITTTIAVRGGATYSLPVFGVGANHSCAANAKAELFCWGYNESGQLGINSDSNISEIVAANKVNLSLTTGEYVTKLALGGAHSCALTNLGRVKCWGRNEYGQLGIGEVNAHNLNIGDATGEMATLTFVNLPMAAVDIVAGASHSCAMVADDTLYCWGDNYQGQLGVGTNGNFSPTPIHLDIEVQKIVLDTAHTCALLADDSLKCWGNNDVFGQLGLGDAINRNAPSAAVNLNGTAMDLSVGGAFSCAVLTSGAVKCWGRNSQNGEEGLGALGKCWAVDGGSFVNCNETSNDPLLGYGNSANQMGVNLSAVSLGVAFVASKIFTGDAFSCAMSGVAGSAQSLKCWGQNGAGQLLKGNLTTLGVLPAQMGDSLTTIYSHATSGTVVDVKLGSAHGCAKFLNGDLRCWGNNSVGQLSSACAQSSYGERAGETSLSSAPLVILP